METLSSPALDVTTQTGPTFPQLRQVRSKFNALSTYRRCRASTNVASPLNLQPSSVWTVSDHDSPQQKASQERIGSSLLQHVATAVIRHHQNATLEKDAVEGCIDQCKETCACRTILRRILDLFSDEAAPMRIIANDKLNVELTLLADVVANGNAAINKQRIVQLEKK
ncbi:hypothetical protein DM01DRAFT_1403425 [Hesseltinella vesiculosa]|uniref:Uncharacterized protein n=1 Tax=Hesseltinella vesiculosa TaxID=101127 RepID=A0A1X2GYD1_9FUNG|nr:hypothetical protein DM01DRAFT_1403425 [Hesseltinella vesiculosa]